jgi:carboxyl-terminal processing protease
MRKRFSLLTVVALVGVSLIAGALLNPLISGDSIYEQLNKFKDVLSITEKYYVEDVDTQKLTESAINGLLSQLDPHSVYIPQTQLKKVTEEFQGSFEGIGIEFQVINDTLLVVAAIAGGPSEALGIQGGDKIVKIDDSSAVGITQEGVQKKLRGPKGSRVKVSIIRAGIATRLEFEIVRDKIPLYTVDASYMVDDETGYVSVNRFAAKTHEEFLGALDKLQGEGMKRLVLDLRGNPGGYLDQAFKMADELMPRGRKIVYTKGRRPEFDDEYVSNGGKYPNLPVIVLVNNSSASASEIVSGAVQDWDRGLIVGETTFGKGLVQRQFDLKDGSAFRLTTARYFTPSGRLIQRPYGADKTKYQMEAYEREETEGETDTMHVAQADSARPKFKTMGGRTVLGGGGITPDYIVKGDRILAYTIQLRGKNAFMKFAERYLDKEGAKLKKAYGKNAGKFAREFEVTPLMVNDLTAIGKADGLAVNDSLLQKDMRFIKTLTKSAIARTVWGPEGTSQVMLREDSQFKKALDLFPESDRILHATASVK